MNVRRNVETVLLVLMVVGFFYAGHQVTMEHEQRKKVAYKTMVDVCGVDPCEIPGQYRGNASCSYANVTGADLSNITVTG